MTATRVSEAELRWKCRRGMLELDLLLNRYIDRAYTTLDAQTERALIMLLEYPDQVLHDLLMGDSVAADNDIAVLVSSIRQL